MTRYPYNQLSDEDLLRLIGEMLDEYDPLPLGALEFASAAFTWRDANAELAQLLHDSARELVDVRAATAAHLLVFQAGDVTLDLEHDHDGLHGAVTPAAQYRVEIRHADGREDLLTDSAGMFEFPGTIEGTVQLAVVDPQGFGVLLTPCILL